MSAPTTFIQHCTIGPRQCNKTRRRNSGQQIGIEEVKLSLFAEEILIYTEYTKEFTK